MRKKIFTLFAMLFCVLGLQAQDTRYYYWNNYKPANSITFSDGAKVAITGDESLVFEKGSKNLNIYTGNGGVKSFPTFKLAKNVQHTFTAPAGKRIATISFITFNPYVKFKDAVPTYWTEVAGVEMEYSYLTALTGFKNTPYGLPYDFVTYPQGDDFFDTGTDFEPGLKKVTFTYTGEQLYGIFWIKLEKQPNEDIYNFFAGNMNLPMSTDKSNAGDITEDKDFEEGDVTLTVSPSGVDTPNRVWGNEVSGGGMSSYIPQLRVYGGTMTFTSDRVMKRIEFTTTTGVGALTPNTGKLNGNAWKGSAKSVVFKVKPDSYTHFNVIMVFYEDGSVEEIPVTVPSAKFTTFVTPTDVTIPSELTAYIVTDVNTNSVSMKPVTNVPANTAIIINANQADKYNLIAMDDDADDVSENKLRASDGTVKGGDGIYALANKSTNGVGFYPVGSNVTIPKGKAYLPAPAGVKGFLALDEDVATSISNVETSSERAITIYNLAGQKVESMKAGGFYIVNGKKVFVK